ncbi:uncharacterized protein LOC136764443 isoform X1 [Amia ocellicauda]|uniref:uncharacterized protein LOC136764443 isoform X1 n=1 Tax=Amia ocellicauda TaxID=2972642 RepID=UPI0034640092
MRASEAALLTVLLTVVVFQPPTTADPVLTTPTANGTRLEIQFTLSQTYTLDLNNHTSTVFRALASNITSTINKIYRGSYSSFLLSEVIGFGSGSIQVDLDLVFNSTGSVPSIDEVVSRLRFSSQSFLPIILPSIKGRGVTPGTLAPPITMNATTANIIMTTAVMETRLELQAALMELFSADLSNQSTAALKNTAQYFTVEIENNFKNSKFKESFLRTEVITLSSQLSGSFLVDFDLVFNSSYPVPHINSAITELMVAIYSNQTALPLDPCFFEHRGVTSEAPPTTATPPSTPPAATATGNTSKGTGTTASTPPAATATGDTTKDTTTTASTPPAATATGNTTTGTATSTSTPPAATATGNTTTGTATSTSTPPAATAPGDMNHTDTTTTASTPPAATATRNMTHTDTTTTASTPPAATATGNTTTGTAISTSTPPAATAPGDMNHTDTTTTASTPPAATATRNMTHTDTTTTASTPPAATATGETTHTDTAPSTMTTAPSSTTTTPTSITATSTATTAAATSSTDAILSTPVPQNTVILIFRIFRDFVSALSDRKSKEFIELSQQLISECDKIFSAQFGSSFISTFVQKFTNGSTITNLQVEFASQTSIPPNNDIIQTFMKAAQNGTFPFAIDLNSIYISNNAAGPSSPFIALLVSIFTALLSSRQFLH